MTAPTATFDRLAGRYARYAQLTAEVYTPWLHQALPAQVDRAVDLGCGSGRWTILLARHAADVLAVDVSAAQLQRARAAHPHPAVSYQQRRILDLTPAHDGLFNLVFAVNALFCLYTHHPPDHVLAHVRDLVAPGGTLVLVDVVLPAHRPRLRHRWWGVQDAAATLARRHSVSDGLAVLRLRQHPDWLAHATTARPLTRPGFHQHATRLLPGADITDDLDRHLAALHWRRPWP